MWMMLCSTLMFSVQSLGNKEYSRRFPANSKGLLLFNGFVMLVIAGLCVFRGGAQLMPLDAMLMTAIYGVAYLATLLLIVRSMATGPLGMTSLMLSASMVIPVIAGIVFWNELLTWLKGLGVILILIVVVGTCLGGQETRKSSLKWLLNVIPMFLMNGLLSIMQKEFNIHWPEISDAVYSFWAFLVGGFLCWLVTAYLWANGERFREWRRPSLLLSALAVGVGSFGGLSFLLSALPFVPAMVLYPTVQSGTLLLVWLISLPLYGEKARAKDWALLALGLGGIVALSL